MKALEDVLHDLYALESLTPGVTAGERPGVGRADGTTDDSELETLTEWRPAREEDEPRIPELYRSAWRGEPDTLLALIRKALRLDEHELVDDEQELIDEKTKADEDSDEDIVEDEVETETQEPPLDPVRTTTTVLKRYRGALVKLLERGVDYVRNTDEPVLADLGFQAVLRLHEELARTAMAVGDEVQPLVESDQLLPQKVRLLDAYLRDPAGRDANCLATARAHLGLCLKAGEQLDPLTWETLERVAHERAADLLGDNRYASRAANDAGVDLGELELVIGPYAQRAELAGFLVKAEEYLDDADGDDEPFPWISGSDWVPSTTQSSVWKLIGYGAVAGFQNRQRYGVLVRNRQPNAKLSAHAVVVDPRSATIHEAFKRAADGTWVARIYSSASEGRVRQTAQTGPDSILDDCHRSPYADVDLDADSPLIELLLAAGEIARA